LRTAAQILTRRSLFLFSQLDAPSGVRPICELLYAGILDHICRPQHNNDSRGRTGCCFSISRTSCWLKFPHSALHFHIRKCFRARKCHRGREYYSTQRKSNLPGREWNSAHQGNRQRDSRRPQETGRRRMAQTGSSRNECGNGRLREPRSLWDSKNFAITEL
jgi:hypothetical protein